MAASAEITQTYISVDSIPEAASLRQEVRDSAWAMVHQREQLLADGQEHLLPLTIDALSTAEQVNQAKATSGEDSADCQDKWAGLLLDCKRLVGEWRRKLRPEYFGLSRHFFDAPSNDFYSHGLSIRQMTENALRPIVGDPEEEGRRVNERVEQETPLILQKVGIVALAGVGIKVRTISECTNKAIQDYQSDIKNGRPHSGYGGYVPEIEKVMVRDRLLEAETNDILEEQVGLPGIYFTHYVIQEALRRRELETADMDKTALHGTQIIVQDDLIEFVQLLDEVASEVWCVNIFMGEVVEADHPKAYDEIRTEAQGRQDELEDMASTVAAYLLDLEQDDVDRRQAPAMVEEFVKVLLINECKKDIQLTVQIFDQKTAEGLAEVVHLESQGRYEEAQALQAAVQEYAPGGGYCSGGSCGLENVNLMTEAGKALAKKVKAEAGDTVVKDKVRACKCGKKQIVYAYNKNKVNKYCQACEAFESKVSKAA